MQIRTDMNIETIHAGYNFMVYVDGEEVMLCNIPYAALTDFIRIAADKPPPDGMTKEEAHYQLAKLIQSGKYKIGSKRLNEIANWFKVTLAPYGTEMVVGQLMEIKLTKEAGKVSVNRNIVGMAQTPQTLNDGFVRKPRFGFRGEQN